MATTMPARRTNWTLTARWAAFDYDGTYETSARGLSSVPGFVNRVDIRELYQQARLSLSSEEGVDRGLGSGIATSAMF